LKLVLPVREGSGSLLAAAPDESTAEPEQSEDEDSATESNADRAKDREREMEESGEELPG